MSDEEPVIYFEGIDMKTFSALLEQAKKMRDMLGNVCPQADLLKDFDAWMTERGL